MGGRKWYDGAIKMCFTLFAECFEHKKKLLDYDDGIMDTLDGSHGPAFTYLPIVYQDDCQVAASESEISPSDRIYYTVEITFLEN